MESIRKITDKIVTAMNEGDLQKFLSVFSDDAALFPPNEPPKTGAALYDMMSDFLNRFDIHFERYVDEEIVKAGEIAINHYSYVWTVTPTAGGETMKGAGHGIRIFKIQRDGAWKVTHEIWSIYPQSNKE
jgi:uncharacterized protein (TIGR02246 family)